jgi:hypothetical protein
VLLFWLDRKGGQASDQAQHPQIPPHDYLTSQQFMPAPLQRLLD